jgi:hypothetical protein
MAYFEAGKARGHYLQQVYEHLRTLRPTSVLNPRELFLLRVYLPPRFARDLKIRLSIPNALLDSSDMQFSFVRRVFEEMRMFQGAQTNQGRLISPKMARSCIKTPVWP